MGGNEHNGNGTATLPPQATVHGVKMGSSRGRNNKQEPPPPCHPLLLPQMTGMVHCCEQLLAGYMRGARMVQGTNNDNGMMMMMMMMMMRLTMGP